MLKFLIFLLGGSLSLLILFIFCSLRLAKICDNSNLK